MIWKIKTISEVNSGVVQSAVNQLSDNTIAAVRIPNAYTKDELATILDNISRNGVTWYPNFEFKQGRIGISATEYASKINGKDAYFMLEAESSKIRDKIFPNKLDPVQKMLNFFSQGFDASIAHEPAPGNENEKYFTGLVRSMCKASTTHFDFAPHQLPGWGVARAQSQLSALIYLQTAGQGGELTIYNRQWNEDDEKYNKDINEKGPNGFKSDFLEGVDSVTIEPAQGELVIFNSKNFHKVEAMTTEAPRLSVNSFVSLIDDKLQLWN